MFQTEGDGWDQFAFPFSDSLFLGACLFKYIHKCACGSFLPTPPRWGGGRGTGQSIHTAPFPMGLSVRLCVEAEPVGLGLSHVVTLGRAAVTCFSVASGFAFV